MRQRAVTPGKVPELEMRTRPGVICATISMVTWTWMADVSAPGCTSPLLMSCLYGHSGITTLLLEHQAIASRASPEGFSPLKTASANGHADVGSFAPSTDALDSSCDNIIFRTLSSTILQVTAIRSMRQSSILQMPRR